MKAEAVILESFLLHDQEGLPLSFQIDVAKSQGVKINLAAFACDALGAGWPEERVKTTMESAVSGFNWANFRIGLAGLWKQLGSPKDPECWAMMKQAIRNQYQPA